MFNSKIISVAVIYCGVLQLTSGLRRLEAGAEAEAEAEARAEAEGAVRGAVDTLFATLRARASADLIHQYLAALTPQDHTILTEIAKLTRVDKSYCDNIIADFTTTIKEIVDEENKKRKLKRIPVPAEKLTKFHFDSDSITKEDVSPLEKGHASDKDDFSWRGGGARRIYNGKRAKIKHFPFMASVQFFGRFQCAGSIIKSDLVLTAASCLQLAWNNRFFRENPAFLSVRVGSSYYEIGGEVINVLEVYFYPSYDPKTLHHNLAIMRLQRKMRFKKKYVKKIELDRAASRLPRRTAAVTIVGWGARSVSNIIPNPYEGKIRFSDLHVYPLEECQMVYSKHYVTHRHFCAGFMSEGSGACNRDVGGPGVVGGALAGVVSFGAPTCGTPDAPTVFTKVGYYFDWIEEIMEQDVPWRYQRTTTKKYTYVYDPSPKTSTMWTVTPIVTTEADNIQIEPPDKIYSLRISSNSTKKSPIKNIIPAISKNNKWNDNMNAMSPFFNKVRIKPILPSQLPTMNEIPFTAGIPTEKTKLKPRKIQEYNPEATTILNPLINVMFASVALKGITPDIDDTSARTASTLEKKISESLPRIEIENNTFKSKLGYVTRMVDSWLGNFDYDDKDLITSVSMKTSKKYKAKDNMNTFNNSSLLSLHDEQEIDKEIENIVTQIITNTNLIKYLQDNPHYFDAELKTNNTGKVYFHQKNRNTYNNSSEDSVLTILYLTDNETDNNKFGLKDLNDVSFALMNDYSLQDKGKAKNSRTKSQEAQLLIPKPIFDAHNSRTVKNKHQRALTNRSIELTEYITNLDFYEILNNLTEKQASNSYKRDNER